MVPGLSSLLVSGCPKLWRRSETCDDTGPWPRHMPILLRHESLQSPDLNLVPALRSPTAESLSRGTQSPVLARVPFGRADTECCEPAKGPGGRLANPFRFGGRTCRAAPRRGSGCARGAMAGLEHQRGPQRACERNRLHESTRAHKSRGVYKKNRCPSEALEINEWSAG